MVVSQEFPSDAHEQYYSIAKGYAQLNVNNIDEIKSIFKSSRILLDDKNAFAEALLKLLASCYSIFNFTERDYLKFSQDPKHFLFKVFSGSDEEKILDKARGLMMLINNIYGQHLAAAQIIDFYEDRCNQNTRLNNELYKECMAILSKMNDVDSLAKVQALRIGAFPIIKDNSLVLTYQEKLAIERLKELPKEEPIEEESTENDFKETEEPE